MKIGSESLVTNLKVRVRAKDSFAVGVHVSVGELSDLSLSPDPRISPGPGTDFGPIPSPSPGARLSTSYSPSPGRHKIMFHHQGLLAAQSSVGHSRSTFDSLGAKVYRDRVMGRVTDRYFGIGHSQDLLLG